MCNLYDIWGVKLAKAQYLPTSFTQRLPRGRRIYKFISICELCLQLANLTSYNVFKQFYCGCGYAPTASEKGMYIKL